MSDTQRYTVWPDPRSESCENDRFHLSSPQICM